MITAQEAKSRLLDQDNIEKHMNRIDDRIRSAIEDGDNYVHYGMENDQDDTDEVIDRLEQLGYNASWNDCLLAVEINWRPGR